MYAQTGIGTTTPINKFEVVTTTADPASSGADANGNLRLGATSTNVHVLDFGLSSTSTFSWLQARSKSAYGTTYNLALNPIGGSVGIGTTSPQQILHVKGGYFRLENSNPTYIDFMHSSAALNNKFARIGNSGGSLVFDIVDDAYVNSTERMRINTSGFVGIGTNSPSTTLTLGNAAGTVSGEITLNPSTTQYEGGQINIKKSLVGSTQDWIIDQYGTTAADARLRFFNVSEVNGFVIKENGFIGMGTSAPSVRLQVAGDIIANSIAGSSDARFKTNISPIVNPLQKVLQLRGLTFDWKTKEFPERAFSESRSLGFIAQEVEQVLPEVVQTEKTPEGYKSVQYDKVVALLVEAIKEQQRQIQILKKEIKKIKHRKK